MLEAGRRIYRRRQRGCQVPKAPGWAAAYYIGEESINQAAANAESDTIEVLKGDVKLDITADDVIVKNSGDGDVTVNDQDMCLPVMRA